MKLIRFLEDKNKTIKSLNMISPTTSPTTSTDKTRLLNPRHDVEKMEENEPLRTNKKKTAHDVPSRSCNPFR